MTTEVQFQEENEAAARKSADLSSAPIRSQLLWSSLFPLALFSLLTTLVIAITIQKITQNLAAERNTARVQLVAAEISGQLADGTALAALDLQSPFQTADIGTGSSLYLLDPAGNLLASFPSIDSQRSPDVLSLLVEPANIGKLMLWPPTQDQVLASSSSIQNAAYRVILVEPWKEIIAPAAGYQILLAVLTFLGVFFSLLMLSTAIRRILQPITLLTERAAKAVPGSVFRPIKENGPQEIRSLTQAFNQMVIRLAKQQTSLRQYAHKALLSQEEERQRLSRELHDGTLQDLVGLHQRIELYRSELSDDPLQAQARLKEIEDLINHSIEEVRSISIALRPPILDDLGLAAAIDSLCKEMKLNKVSLSCTFTCTGEAQRLSADMELAVYRVVQEALTNIRKHVPDATRVKVELAYGQSEIRANIRNDGSSFVHQDVQGFVKSGHIGLAGMYERARLFGGSLKIRSTAGEDTLISLRLPYELAPSQV